MHTARFYNSAFINSLSQWHWHSSSFLTLRTAFSGVTRKGTWWNPHQKKRKKYIMESLSREVASIFLGPVLFTFAWLYPRHKSLVMSPTALLRSCTFSVKRSSISDDNIMAPPIFPESVIRRIHCTSSADLPDHSRGRPNTFSMFTTQKMSWVDHSRGVCVGLSTAET